MTLETGEGNRVPGKGDQPFDDLDALAGTWKVADAEAFEAATTAFSEVDPAFWK